MASAECNHPTCSGDRCRREKKEKKKHSIPAFAKSKEKARAEYASLAKVFREQNPVCCIKSKVCTGGTQGVHHVKGKVTPELLLDQGYWLPACNSCNDYLESNPLWAIANGFKLPNYGSRSPKI
jgi:hypothetical protein